MKKNNSIYLTGLFLLFSILISGMLFNLCVCLGAGIANVFAILLFSFIYAAGHCFLMIRYNGAKRVVFLVGGLISAIALHLPTKDLCLFGAAFNAFNSDYIKEYGKPNAGSGFGMIVAIIINCFAFLTVSAVGVIDLV